MSRVPPSQHYLCPVEAAMQAGAAYVWQAAYAKGRSDGWIAGWAAANVKQRKRHINSVASHEAGKGDEEDEAPMLELTEECARLFARSATPQKRHKPSQPEPAPNETEQFDLGGLVERRRRRNAEKMYGDHATHIAQLEADLCATFGQIASEMGASYWPVVSLRDGQRPGNR